MASRSCSGICKYELSSLHVPSNVSSATSPPPSDTISRQMFTLSEISAGTPAASASATATPKFSWCDGSRKTSAACNAPISWIR